MKTCFVIVNDVHLASSSNIAPSIKVSLLIQTVGVFLTERGKYKPWLFLRSLCFTFLKDYDQSFETAFFFNLLATSVDCQWCSNDLLGMREALGCHKPLCKCLSEWHCHWQYQLLTLEEMKERLKGLSAHMEWRYLNIRKCCHSICSYIHTSDGEG